MILLNSVHETPGFMLNISELMFQRGHSSSLEGIFLCALEILGYRWTNFEAVEGCVDAHKVHAEETGRDTDNVPL